MYVDPKTIAALEAGVAFLKAAIQRDDADEAVIQCLSIQNHARVILETMPPAKDYSPFGI